MSDDEDQHFYTEDDFQIRVTPSSGLGVQGKWDWQLWNMWTNESCGMDGLLNSYQEAEDKASAHRATMIKQFNDLIRE